MGFGLVAVASLRLGAVAIGVGTLLVSMLFKVFSHATVLEWRVGELSAVLLGVCKLKIHVHLVCLL